MFVMLFKFTPDIAISASFTHFEDESLMTSLTAAKKYQGKLRLKGISRKTIFPKLQLRAHRFQDVTSDVSS